jgi:tRNA1(Val) A37 N6-methylase TrmN6
LIQVELKDLQFKSDFNIDVELFADWFQLELSVDVRKIFAANYTSVNLDKNIRDIFELEKFKTIIDPFCGSGRLLVTFINTLPKGVPYPKIILNEYMLFPATLAYYDLIKHYQLAGQNIDKIRIFLGDGFSNVLSKFENKCDLVIMNPPFTRVHKMDSGIRQNLEDLKQKYPNLVSGQPGLHYYALLLSDKLLREDGRVISILPGSTFTSVYSKPLMAYYLDKYIIQRIIKFDDSSAFSDGSDIKEIVFMADKNSKRLTSVVNFTILKNQNQMTSLETNEIPISNLYNNWNWLKFFENIGILELENYFLETNMIKSGNELNLKIIRGVEMYGPDFFCLPNRHWDLKDILNSSVTFTSSNNKSEVKISNQFLIKSLRKSALYNHVITPEFSDYLLSIPNSTKLDKHLQHYISTTETNADAAKRKFEANWLYHIYSQIKAKTPFGKLFFIDKLGIETSAVLAHYLDEDCSSTKNFYIIKSSNSNLELQGAWLNSTIFLLFYLINRRELGTRFGRMQIVDLENTNLFLDTEKISSKHKKLILEKFEIMRHIDLPNIPDQIDGIYRYELDCSIMLGLGYSNDETRKLLDTLYKIILSKFSN